MGRTLPRCDPTAYTLRRSTASSCDGPAKRGGSWGSAAAGGSTMPREPDIAFAQRLLRLGRREGDREGLRRALPELMLAADTAGEREEVRKLVQRLFTERGPLAESRWLDMRAAGRVAPFAYAWAVRRPHLVAGARR